jgi:hypothetical protein
LTSVERISILPIVMRLATAAQAERSINRFDTLLGVLSLRSSKTTVESSAGPPPACAGLETLATIRLSLADRPAMVRNNGSEFENVIVLSDEFCQGLVAHPFPNDLEAARVLAASPAVLDLLMWLSHRCFTTKGTESIALFGNFGRRNRIGTTEYSRPRRVRALSNSGSPAFVRSDPIAARISPDGQAIIIKDVPAVLPAERNGGVVHDDVNFCWDGTGRPLGPKIQRLPR